jgi:glycosyltransferase involved in cell wall biosynthesis
VVTTRVGALPDLVTDGETGDLVAPRDAAGLADALARLMHEPERRRRYGAAGRARYEAELTDARFEQRLLACLSGALRP